MKMKRKFPGLMLLLGVGVLVLTGCSSDGSGGGAGHPPVTSAEIGPGGGTITSPDGKMKLTIPAGAMGNTETITIESVDPSTLPPEFSGGNSLAAYKLGPDGTQFSQPIEVTAKLDEQPVQPDGSLTGTAAILLTSSNGVLEAMEEPSVVLDGAANTTTVTGKLRHFSFVELRAPEGVESFKLPHVQVTELPIEMLVNDPKPFIVQVDRSNNPTWLGKVEFFDQRGEDVLIFEGVGLEPIDVGAFKEGDSSPILSKQVGLYTCVDVGTGVYQPVVRFTFVVPVILDGKVVDTTIRVEEIKSLERPNVNCVRVLGLSPTVTSTSPSDGAPNVPTNTEITATFSEPMLPFNTVDTSTGPASFVLKDLEGNRIEVVPTMLSSDRLTATFKPKALLPPDTMFTATITTEATDLAGHRLAADYSWKFKTAATGSSGGNELNLSNGTGSIPPNLHANPTCTVTPNSAGTEIAVLCNDLTKDVFFAAYINLLTRGPRLFVLQVKIDEIIFAAVVDCMVEACTGIETNFTKDVISSIFVRNFFLQFYNIVKGGGPADGTSNLDAGFTAIPAPSP